MKELNGNVRTTNFPGISESYLLHVRPHARNAADTFPLPVRDKLTGATEYTKHCFWINNSFISEIVADDKN